MSEIQMQATKSDFARAVIDLVGAQIYENMMRSNMTIHNQVDEVCRYVFLGEHDQSKGEALALVRKVALNLWRVDGTHGLLSG